MKQLSAFRYVVEEDEIVTTSITPIRTGGRVAAAQNREKLDNDGTDDAPLFEFTADEMPGNTHYLVLDFTFVAADDNDASFKINFKGSKGGSFKDVRRVKKASAKHDPVFRFLVVGK